MWPLAWNAPLRASAPFSPLLVQVVMLLWMALTMSALFAAVLLAVREGSSTFVSTMPISRTDLARAKMRAVTRGLLISLLSITPVAFAAVFLATLRVDSWETRWTLLAEGLTRQQAMLLVPAIYAFAFVMAWREMPAVFILSNIPNRLWRLGAFLAYYCIAISTPLYAVEWILNCSDQPEVVWPIVTKTLAALAILKVCLAIWPGGSLLFGSNSDRKYVRDVLLSWLAISVGVYFFVVNLVPNQALPRHVLVLGITVALPLNRVLALPLFIGMARHR
jgi:hypothetical protein